MAQTEDTLVVELLYKADNPATDNEVLIDRATIFRYGDVKEPSVPLEYFSSLTYEIPDSFGSVNRKGLFTFDRAMLESVEGKIPVKVYMDSIERTGFIKIPYQMDIRFNFYTDKIKPVLNFWINVEATYENGSILPLSADEVIITTSYGEVEGLELKLPEEPEVDEVTITACLRESPDVCIEQTVPIMKQDDWGYWEDEEEYDPNRFRKDSDEANPSDSTKKDTKGAEVKQYYFPDEDDEVVEDVSDDETSEDIAEKEEYDGKWDYLFKKVKKIGRPKKD